MFHTTVNGVECYGELRDDSNFQVVCEDEEDDDVWCDGNPNHPEFVFESWKDVVAELQQHFGSEIVEISAV
jgi:hypothetical protein